MRLSAALVIATVMSAPCAQAATNNWYLAVGAGGSWMSGKADFANQPDTTMDYRAAARFSGAVGYKWDNWRFEIEPDLVTNNAGLIGYNGGTTVEALIANAAYDYHLTDRWMLTAGAGLGAAHVSHDISQNGTNVLLLGGHGTGIAWQLSAGVGYELTYNVELAAEYRYMRTDGTGAVSQAGPARFENAQNNIVMASLRWYPFAREEAASPPPPPPAPPPAPPPPTHSYIVFFDFDKADLTADARQVVAQAVSSVQHNGFARIVVTGHTDTVGTSSYNQRLSEQRAANVKAAMVSLGLDANTIATAGRGFSDPLVATAMGVRELKNRRAVIDLE